MNFLSKKNIPLGVLVLNIIFMIITLTHLSRQKIVQYAASGTPRTLFIISIILSIVALVFAIMEKKKGNPSNILISIINIVLAILIILLPSISLATIYSSF